MISFVFLGKIEYMQTQEIQYEILYWELNVLFMDVGCKRRITGTVSLNNKELISIFSEKGITQCVFRL